MREKNRILPVLPSKKKYIYYIGIFLIYSLGSEAGVSWFLGVLDCIKINPRQPYFYEILDQTRLV